MTAIAIAETTAAPMLVGLSRRLIGQIRARALRSAQRRTLMGLLELDQERLDDLGVSASDVHSALNEAGRMGAVLHASRAKRALRWSPTPARSH